MGASMSTPEKIAKCCRMGDANSLGLLLADLQRNDASFRANRSRYLESKDDNGSTPLVLAAARGHIGCVKLLLQFGANVHHVNAKPDGGSALHEAVGHKHDALVELLLSHGSNPFVENVKGFTAMDIACSSRNVPLLRRLEQCAPYVGWLLVKVPQFGGLGASWQRRWVVVSHRYPNPQAPSNRQLTHCVFLAYKSLASTAPSCRVWLDGARAREVYNPKAEARLLYGPQPGLTRIAQVGITLHRKHEQPSGVYTTGGTGTAAQDSGFTFYLRPDEGSQPGVLALDRLMRTVNNRGFPAAPSTAGAAAASSAAAPGPGPLYSSIPALAGGAPHMAATPGDWGAVGAPGGRPPLEGTESDEQIARRLQEEYDAEAAQQMQQSGGSPARPQQQQQQQQQGAGAAAAGAASGADYLTGSFYPPVHFDQAQPGSAPAATASTSAQQGGFLQTTSSAPPQMAGAMQAAAAAAAGGSRPSTPGGDMGRQESYARPSAPSLLDADLAGPGPMPLGQGLGLGGAAPTYQQLSASGRRLSAPGLQTDSSWAGDTPVLPASRPASEAGVPGAAGVQPQAPNGDADESATCVYCMDALSTSGVLHGDTVHKCLCKECALLLKDSRVKECPLCRQPIEAFIMRVF